MGEARYSAGELKLSVPTTGKWEDELTIWNTLQLSTLRSQIHSRYKLNFQLCVYSEEQNLMPARGGSRSPMIADKAHPSGARARATRRLLLALLVGVSAAAVLNWASMTFLWSGAESSRPRSKAAAARRPAGLSRKQEACVVAAVDSSAGVHSRIDKGGPLDIRLWHANHSDWRGDRFRKWAARGVVNPHTFPHSRVGLEGVGAREGAAGSSCGRQREQRAPSGRREAGRRCLRRAACALSGHVLVSGPPAFPYCRVFVNHQYKILYLRAPKVASTTILGFFGSCGRPDQGGNKTSCLSPLEEVGSAAAYSEMWRSYFVFGFTRNPWARAVSSFRMLERYLAPRAPGCHAAATWRAFCADPSSVGRLHHEMPQCSRPG